MPGEYSSRERGWEDDSPPCLGRVRPGLDACAPAVDLSRGSPRPDRIQAVHLISVCPWAEGESKDVSTVLLGSRLLRPTSCTTPGAWTGAVLMPHQVTAFGQGRKGRHLLPGVYTRPGPAPTQPMTCDFAGTPPTAASTSTSWGP